MRDKKIVIGYDGSPAAEAALTWALDEADRTGMRAELVYADEYPAWAPAASMVPSPALRPSDYRVRVIGGMLRRAVTESRQTHPMVPVTATAVTALASTALAERSEHAGLIVLGTRGHAALAGLLGSVGAAVGAHAHCPVVVVHDGTAPPASTAPVVAGLDHSSLAPAVLRFAAEQAADRDVALRVLGSRPEADAAVAGIRDDFPGLAIRTEAVHGEPGQALVAAGKTAQLLVIGSRGHGAVRGLLLGAVSRHLLRHATCPIAIVPEAVPAGHPS
ncbi:universal stress protein [Actinoplanes oblitus]|uniref:Universal stress protein n=1 Tax=Actinoplanes oblitus TaxID=3040509 RepID=A0ABY8W713_9ACTN|nr:universal stress protein [Actinoplanes oblitus]WIM92941.1 universal stress protein [Actinoplanes oblitus]